MRRCRLVETLGLLVVVRHQRPFGGSLGRRQEGVRYLAVQPVPKTRRRKFRSPLPQQLVVKAPAVLADRLKHPAAPQLLEHFVDLAHVHLDNG